MPVLPLPFNEQERLGALESYQIFDSAEEDDYDAITALASSICKIPIALITFIDDQRQWFKSHHGTELTENLREFSFCTHAIASGEEIMIVPDARLDERFVDNPMVTGPTKVLFYAGVPLINENGYALGTLCVIDQMSHDLSGEQIVALKTLAKQVVDKVELRKKVSTLEKANQTLINSNALIHKFASMAAHDIKNPLTTMLLTSQALKHRSEKLEDNAFIRLVDTNISSTKALLGLVDEMLAYSKSPSLLLENKQEFRINDILRKVKMLLNLPSNIIIYFPDENHIISFSAIAFEQIFLNLLSNAVRYNDKNIGFIKIRFNESEDFYRFEVEDNGTGIPERYLERIFEINFTLNATDRNNEKGTGIGLSTVKDLVRSLNGDIFVRSEIKLGSTFFMSFKK